MADIPVCPETGAPMRRDARPMPLNYKGQSITFDMPGWYCDASDQSTHTGEDMKVSDRMLNLLKARSEGLIEPEGIRDPQEAGPEPGRCRRADRRRPARLSEIRGRRPVAEPGD